MTKARKEPTRYRTPPEQPKQLLGAMFERTAPNGVRHFFGFVGGNKLLLFPTGELSTGGDQKWNLFSQSLHPADTGKIAPDDPARIDAKRFEPFPPRELERLPFVSGLPDKFGGER
jgi:hypothetical protein